MAGSSCHVLFALTLVQGPSSPWLLAAAAATWTTVAIGMSAQIPSSFVVEAKNMAHLLVRS